MVARGNVFLLWAIKNGSEQSAPFSAGRSSFATLYLDKEYLSLEAAFLL